MTIDFELWIEIVVAGLLVVTALSCGILYYRLSTLRNAQKHFQQMLEKFSSQTELAQSSITDLRVASADIGAEMQKQLSEARALRDELRLITASGNDLADRLEAGILGKGNDKSVAAKVAEATKKSKEDSGRTAKVEAEPLRSESELALLKALRKVS